MASSMVTYLSEHNSFGIPSFTLTLGVRQVNDKPPFASLAFGDYPKATDGPVGQLVVGKDPRAISVKR